MSCFNFAGDAGSRHIAHAKINKAPLSSQLKWIWKCIHVRMKNSKLKPKAAACRRSIVALSSGFPKHICMQHMCGLTAKNANKSH